MPEAFSIYIGIGILASLVGFMLLFRKFDLPGYCRRKYRLNTRLKAVGFALVTGVLLAFLAALLLSITGVNPILAEILEGAAIGFNCAMLVGIVRPPEPKGNHPVKDGRRKRQYPSKGNRRGRG